MRLLTAALLGAVTVEAFGPPARATTQPLARADFSPIDFSSTTERLDTTRLNYDGTGEQQCMNHISPRFVWPARPHRRREMT